MHIVFLLLHIAKMMKVQTDSQINIRVLWQAMNVGSPLVCRASGDSPEI